MMPYDEARQIETLVSLYRQAFDEILQMILTPMPKAEKRYWQDMLVAVNEVLRQVDAEADRWIETNLGIIYSQAQAQAVRMLLAAGKQARPEFARVHQRAVDVIAQNMSDNLRSATQFVGRRVKDVFRQVGITQAGIKLAAGQTVEWMQGQMVQTLLDQGQTAFIDRLGRRWRLDTYAKMVARTTTREAASVATINTCQEFGVGLVRITVHYPTCGKCAPLQGKVFSLGADRRYPKLKDEYRPPIHPNCRHVLVPYVREFDDDAEGTQRYSNLPLDKDPRTEAEKAAYLGKSLEAYRETRKTRIKDVLLNPASSYDDKVHAAAELAKMIDKEEVPGLPRERWQKYLLPSRIKQAKTVEEMEQILEETMPWLKAEFTEVDVAFAEKAILQFARLEDEFPEAAREIRYIGTYRGSKAPENFKDYNWDPSVWAHCATEYGWVGEGHIKYIGLNPSWWSHEEWSVFADELERSVKIRWHPPGCKTAESVITHEFGHAYMDWARRQVISPYIDPATGFGQVGPMLQKMYDKIPPTKATLSEYATQNDREAFAEAFAAIKHSPEITDAYTLRLKSLIEVLKVERVDPKEARYIFELPEEAKREAKEQMKRLKQILRWDSRW